MIITNNMSWKTMRVAGVTVSVQPKPKTPYSILRVASLIDTGTGGQTVILKNALPEAWEIDLDKKLTSKTGLSLPRRIANLSCVYTGKKFGVVADVEETLKALTRGARLATIVPDVAAPGDFMIFRHDVPFTNIKFAGVMRAIPLR
jgi:hypothetical protein